MSEIQPGRILSDEDGTRYVELSAEYPLRVCWVSFLGRKVAGFGGGYVCLMESGSGSGLEEVRVVLTEQEFSTLVASWQQYHVDMEQRPAVAREEEGYDPFLDFE